ncbi:TonB-dependent receptor domain-containing protein [Marinicella sediminis]|uniref:TonB-dependent receptor domain-containing protein n=1 Tax=Marinicella sediminis TaxID=1792834 RepID=A0ABV7JGP2_9GAMM|nr:TonB-dependent receptor [Marinicella sediminis]
MNQKIKLNALALMISGIISGSALAQTAVEVSEQQMQENNQQEHTEDMAPMKVWGTKVKATSVNISDEDITMRQADHLSDLLRSIPGVDVGGAHSLNQRINIRGLDDKDLAITIDGAVQNTYMYHHMGNLQIHADILKAVAVEVGTNSVVNGGLGGAVRFETKEAKDLLDYGQQFGGRIQGSFANNDSIGGSLSLFGQLNDQWDVLAYYNHVDRDNYVVGGGRIVGSDGVVINEDGEVKGLAGTTKDGLLKFGLDISAHQRLEFGLENYHDEGQYSYRPDMGLATDLAIADNLGLPLTYPTEFTRDTYTLNHELFWGENSSLRTAVYHNNSHLRRDESGIAVVFPDSPSLIEGTARNEGFSVLGRTELSHLQSHQLTYGVEFVDYTTTYQREGQEVSGEDANNFALYIEDRIGFDNGFYFTPGIRYDRYDVDSVVVNNTFDEVTLALALDYAVTERLNLGWSSTQLFKGPELSEVFVGAGIRDTENPNIKAETGVNHQLSFTYQAGHGFDFGATLFRTEIDDYIYEYADDNVGDLSIDGFEAFISHRTGQLTTLLTYASQDSELDAFTSYPEFEGSRLDRSIGDNIDLTFDYLLPNLNLHLFWNTRFVDKLGAELDLDELNNPKKAHTVHNFSMRWVPQQQFQGLELTLGVDNLFDKLYASHASRTGDSFHPRFGALHLTDYEPGRNVKFTLAYKF